MEISPYDIWLNSCLFSVSKFISRKPLMSFSVLLINLIVNND